MRKYLYIFKSELMSNIHYIFNNVTAFIGCFMLLFVLLNLWKYMYSDPNDLINGYNMNQTIWYIIITEIIWGILGGRKLCNKISTDVKSGNIAYNINKPYNYVGYALFNHLGYIFVKGIVYIILGLLTGLLFLKSFPNINILEFIYVLITIIMAISINILLVIIIGLFSFFIEDSNPFYWVYSKFILIVGTLFPIEFFPKMIQPILTYSPIYVIAYGPAKLFVDFNYFAFVKVFFAQIIYFIIIYLLCLLIYKKGVRKLNVNGG